MLSVETASPLWSIHIADSSGRIMGRLLRLFSSMEYKDYCKILGVDRDATSKDVKRACQKLTRKYHPDVSKEPDAEARFKEVGEDYAVLKDPEKRAAYDQPGPDWKAGQD